MARKALVFWLLQFSPLIAAASASGINATSDNCVDFDMAKVEDLISALRAVEDPKIDADEGGEELQPFGHFKTDWSRLNLLQKSLPEDSVLKDKFKHIFRLLTVAHNQGTQAFISSESTKTHDDFVRQSTISLAKDNRTDDRQIDDHPVNEVHGKSLGSKKQEISEKFNTPTTPISDFTQGIRDPSTTSDTSDVRHPTSGTSGPNTLSPKSKEAGIDAVLKSATEISADLDEEKEINVAANATDLKPTVKSSVTTAASIPTLAPLIESSATAAASSSTFHSAMESSVTTAASIRTSEPVVKSSIAATPLPISDSGIKFPVTNATSIPTLKPFPKSPALAAAPFSMFASATKSTVTTAASIRTSEPVVKSSTAATPLPTSDSGIKFPVTNATSIPTLKPVPKSPALAAAPFSMFASATKSTATTAASIRTSEPVVKSSTAATPLPTSDSGIKFPVTNATSIPTLKPVPKSPALAAAPFSMFASATKSTVTTAASIRTSEPVAKSSTTATPLPTSDSGIKFPVTNATSIPTLKPFPKSPALAAAPFSMFASATKSTVTTAASIPSLEFRKPSIASSILTTISEEEIKSSTSAQNEVGRISETLSSKSAATDKEANLTANATKQYSAVTIAKTLKYGFTESSTHIEYSSIGTTPESATTDAQTLQSISSESDSLSPTDTKINYSPESAITADPMQPFTESSTHKEYTSIRTTPNSETADVQTWKSISSKSDSLSPTDVTNRNSSPQSATTGNPVERITTTEKYVSARTLSKFEPTKNQSIVSVTTDKLSTSSTQKSEEIGLTTSDNRTENVLSVNSTPIVSETTTHFVEDVINITSTTGQVPEIELTTEEHLIEVSKSKNSATDTPHITTATEKDSSVTPSISDSEKLTTTGINNQTETPMKEETSEQGRRSTDPTQSASTTKNPVYSQTNPIITPTDLSVNLGDPTPVTETFDLHSHSQNWPIKSKPSFEKNPLYVVSSSGNNIVRDYKHGSLDTGTATNSDSHQIVLDEISVGAKTGNDWRPQFKRPTPVGNNIRQYDGFPNNGGPYGYGYGRPAPPANGKSGIRKNEKNPVKLSALGSRKNLVRSRKRGSANADVEKQFRSFYIQHKPRVKESDNSKIKIQCKKLQQPH